MTYTNKVNNKDDVDHHQQQQPSEAVLRRFALFVDGMARAMILPFGPTLVYRLIHKVRASEEDFVTPARWSAISLQLALVIASFGVGHMLGSLAAEKIFSIRQGNISWVARLGGAAIALHIFSCGAGLSSVVGLVAIRFVSAVVVGILCTITDVSSLPEGGDTTIVTSSSSSLNGSSENAQPQQPLNIASGTAKIYLAGFAVSILSGGLFYRPASANNTFQALTGSYALTWPLFLIVTTIVGERLLRRAFYLTAQPEHFDDQTNSGTVRSLRRLVRRVVAGKQQQRVSFQDPESLQLLGSTGGGPLRQRSSTAGSATTEIDMNEFYDCQSEYSDDPMSPSPKVMLKIDASDDNDTSSNHDNEMAIYQNGKCRYADGSPAFVSSGDSVAKAPSNFLQDCKGDRNQAMKRWQETQQWRREKNVWNIHSIPNKFFREIKKAYPHIIHGYSKQGFPVVYELPGKMELKSLFRGECTIEAMVHHYIFFQEYLNNCLCASQELREKGGRESVTHDSSAFGVMVVMDVKGAGITSLSTDVLRYLKRAGEIVGAHYPMSMKCCCVANTPFWASGVYNTVRAVLPDSVVIELVSASDTADKLKEYIDTDQLPAEYGGTSPYKFGEHPFEVQLRELVDSAAQGDIETPMNVQSLVSKAPQDLAITPKKEVASEPVADLPSDKNVRRRQVAPVLESQSSVDTDIVSNVHIVEQAGIGVDFLGIISFFCAFHSGAQGGIEIAVPLWLSSPIVLGGLGYTPSKNAIVMFSAAVALFGLLSTRISRLISQMPRNDPIRAIRIGLGLQSASFFLLAFVPIYIS